MSNYSPSPAELQVFTVSDGVVHKSGSDLMATLARNEACYILWQHPDGIDAIFIVSVHC